MLFLCCADVIGLVGSAGFVPLSFIYPCLFYVLAKKANSRAETWLCWSILIIMSVAGFLAVVGSSRNIIVRAQAYHL